MRVALDVGPLYGPRTGVGEAVVGMRTALDAHEEVTIDGYLVSGRATPRPGDRKLPLPGIVAAHLWSRADVPRADRWLAGCDLVHGTNYVAPPSRLPTVVSVYDCWFLAHPDLAGPLVRRAGAVLRRRVADGAWIHTGATAVSTQASELLGTDRVVTVPLGPPAPIAELAALPAPPAAATLGGRPFVLALGTQEKRKDLTLLIAAFDELAHRLPDVRLVLAGAPGDDSAAVAAAIAALEPGIATRILPLGFVDEATKHWLLRSAALVAYPSLDEGFGFPVLEGHAAGTPVVATRVGALPEVAGDAAAFVEERSPEALAAVLERVLTDSAQRLMLIEAGYRNLTRFSWDRTATGLIDLYRTALDDRR